MKDTWLRIIGIPSLGIIMQLVFCPGTDYFTMRFIMGLIISIGVTAIIWEGNRRMWFILRKYLRWEAYPQWRIIVQVALGIAYAVSIVLLTNYVVCKKLSPIPTTPQQRNIMLMLAATVTIMMNAVYESMYFAHRWRLSFIRAEVLKRANLRSQFETLKNQVNPHFLFNSLNTLTALIEEEPALAVKFVHELSGVYRYVLQSKDRKLVSVSEELKFVDGYVFLLKMRFGQNLEFVMDLTEEEKKMSIPPLTLQILVENAVKHNIISRDKPLSIRLYVSDGRIVVSNNLQRKQNTEDSTRIGLSNIIERYSFLVEKPVEVLEDALSFNVKLPVLEKL